MLDTFLFKHLDSIVNAIALHAHEVVLILRETVFGVGGKLAHLAFFCWVCFAEIVPTCQAHLALPRIIFPDFAIQRRQEAPTTQLVHVIIHFCASDNHQLPLRGVLTVALGMAHSVLTDAVWVSAILQEQAWLSAPR